MRLSAKTLKNVDSLNSWQYSENWIIRQDGMNGEATTLYFQLVDLDRAGIRYIPSDSPSVTVTFLNIDDDLAIVRSADPVFLQDGSIWKVELTSADLPASGNVIFSLFDNGKTHKFSIMNGLSVELVNAGGC